MMAPTANCEATEAQSEAHDAYMAELRARVNSIDRTLVPVYGHRTADGFAFVSFPDEYHFDGEQERIEAVMFDAHGRDVFGPHMHEESDRTGPEIPEERDRIDGRQYLVGYVEVVGDEVRDVRPKDTVHVVSED